MIIQLKTVLNKKIFLIIVIIFFVIMTCYTNLHAQHCIWEETKYAPKEQPPVKLSLTFIFPDSLYQEIMNVSQDPVDPAITEVLNKHSEELKLPFSFNNNISILRYTGVPINVNTNLLCKSYNNSYRALTKDLTDLNCFDVLIYVGYSNIIYQSAKTHTVGTSADMYITLPHHKVNDFRTILHESVHFFSNRFPGNELKHINSNIILGCPTTDELWQQNLMAGYPTLLYNYFLTSRQVEKINNSNYSTCEESHEYGASSYGNPWITFINSIFLLIEDLIQYEGESICDIEVNSETHLILEPLLEYLENGNLDYIFLAEAREICAGTKFPPEKYANHRKEQFINEIRHKLLFSKGKKTALSLKKHELEKIDSQKTMSVLSDKVFRASLGNKRFKNLSKTQFAIGFFNGLPQYLQKRIIR